MNDDEMGIVKGLSGRKWRMWKREENWGGVVLKECWVVVGAKRM